MSVPYDQILANLGNAGRVYRGATSGTAMGDVGAVGAGSRLYGSLAGNPGFTGFGNDIGGALGLIQGLETGGWKGDAEAAASGLQLAGGIGSQFGNSALSSLAPYGGYIAAPLAVYNAIENYQSGATGTDALNDAEAGAAVGSLFGPIGAGVGLIAGGIIGAGTSAFGDGRTDPEMYNWQGFVNATNGANPDPSKVANMTSLQNMSPLTAYNLLAGNFDTHLNNDPLVNKFGRMQSGAFLNDMTQQVDNAYKSGKLSANATPQQMFSQVVTPWLSSQGVMPTPTMGGVQLDDVMTNLLGQWQTGNLNRGTALTTSGTTDPNLPTYGGAAPPPTPTPGEAPPAQRAAAPVARSMMPRMMEPQTPQMHEGGNMKKSHSGLDQLWELYAGPHFTEREHFDDGGYASYSSYDSGGNWAGSSSPTPAPPSDSLPEVDVTATRLGNDYLNPNLGLSQSELASILNGGYSSPSSGSSGSSSSGGHSILGDLGNAWKNLSGQNGIGALLKGVAGLSPLASLFIRSKTNTNAPQPVPGMTQGARNPNPPMFSRSQATSPSNLPGKAPMTLADWYTYGSRPEATFFNNNSVPLAKATGVSSGMAKGGIAQDGVFAGMPEFDSSMQSHVHGPGDGTSDSIPAQLSDGEYVMDANTVSMLGNGSNKAGAERLDQLRENLRKHAAGSMSKGKQFMKAKPPASYIGRGKKGQK